MKKTVLYTSEPFIFDVSANAIIKAITFIFTSFGNSSMHDFIKELRSKINVQFLVAFIEKDGNTFLPSGDSIITEGTILGVLVSKEHISEIIEQCGSIQKELKKVALIGAGRIGTIISEKMIGSKDKNAFSQIFSHFKSKAKNKMDFVIIDNDDERTKEASERFEKARVMCADASDENFIREEKINTFDI